jgi:ABC-type Fe3+ transport system permease subunit
MNMWILETRTESIRIEPVEVLKFEWMEVTKHGLTFGLIFGLIFGLMFGLLAGLSFGLIYGLAVGLRTESMDLKTRPNQGIERSIINSVSIGLVFGLISVLISGLMSWLPHGISLELMMRLTDGLIGLPGGLFAGMIFGGFACVQHLTLRLLLYQNDCIPWNYARFLNYCTERLLLQRVGGRYRFVHKLLQDHFARMAGDEV